MMIFQLLTLFLIPFILAVFMSGRSLILIFFGALTSQATVAVAFSLLSSRDGAECMGMGHCRLFSMSSRYPVLKIIRMV